MAKRIISIILVFVLSAVLLPVTYAASAVNITIDGQEVLFTDDLGFPFIDENNRTQVPFRVTLEAIGASVDWEAETSTAIASKGNIIVQVPIGESYILKNGERIENDTTSRIYNDRTYLPIRIVLEAFGYEVGWIGDTRTVTATKLNVLGGTVTVYDNSTRIDFEPTDEIPYYWYVEYKNDIDREKVNTIMLSNCRLKIGETWFDIPPVGYDGEGAIYVMWDVSNQLDVINVGILFADAHENSGRGWCKESYFIEAFYTDGVVEDEFRQPHKILERVIDKSIEVLAEKNIEAEKKVVMMGFSSTAIFAQRFAVLSPDYVNAIVAGQAGGGLLMPFEEINGQQLDFPSGIANYSDENITGEDFDRESYNEIKQLIYVPSNDASSPALPDLYESNSDSELRAIVNEFGTLGPTRIYRQVKYIQEQGFENVYFHTYDNSMNPGNAHAMDMDLMINFISDVLDGDSGDALAVKYNTSDEEVAELFSNNMIIRYDIRWVVDYFRSLLTGEDPDAEYNVLYFEYCNKNNVLSSLINATYVYTADNRLVIMSDEFDTIPFVIENYQITEQDIICYGDISYQGSTVSLSDVVFNDDTVDQDNTLSQIQSKVSSENYDLAVE